MRRIVAFVMVAGGCLVPPAQAATPPLPATPSYDAFGVAGFSGGRLFAIARRGLRHTDDPSGAIGFFRRSGDPDWNTTLPAEDSPLLDDRNVAGGQTLSGRFVFFYASRDAGGVWRTMKAVSTPLPWDEPADVSRVTIDTGSDPVYSPYGPLVALPSGRFMQTFYSRDTHGVSHTWVMFAGEANGSWGGRVDIDAGPTVAPSETAAALVDGATDATAKLIAIARTQWKDQGVTRYGLVQYSSPDGGLTWNRLGLVPSSVSTGAVMPWLVTLSNGRVALVWADRGSLSIKVSIAAASDAYLTPDAWPEPRELYASRLGRTHPVFRQNFGYPSVADAGPLDSQKIVVFYDEVLAPTDQHNPPADVDLLWLPLTAQLGDDPLPLSY